MPGHIEVASQEFIQQDIINIKTLLCALRGVLVVSFELTTALWEMIGRNIFFQDGIKTGDEIENIDSLESEELLSVACVIEKLSENFTNEAGGGAEKLSEEELGTVEERDFGVLAGRKT